MRVERIAGGWAAYGDGWAVHGQTEEEAIANYEEAERRHKVIDSRPLPGGIGTQESGSSRRNATGISAVD